MKINQGQLKQIIKEELEVVLTNEEAGELFGEELEEILNEKDLEEKKENAPPIHSDEYAADSAPRREK